MLKAKNLVVVVLVCMIVTAGSLIAQTGDYVYRIGHPTFSKPEPVDLGFLNLANGNLRLEISLGNFPQRGSLDFTPKLIYDSRIYRIASGAWQADNVPSSNGGWRYITTADRGTISYTQSLIDCGTIPVSYATIRNNWSWTEPDGTVHYFPLSTAQNACGGGGGTPTASGHADDSTGFWMSITNYTDVEVHAPSGTKVYTNTNERIIDTNGNYISTVSGARTDTLARVPVSISSSGNETYYDVLTSSGSTQRWTVTTTTISVNTAFGQSGVTEYSGNLTVVSSIELPDGSTYDFSYDSGSTSGHYGLVTGVTLRTGGSVSFGYTTFADAYGIKNRWLTSRTSGGGTWSYTPSVVGSCGSGETGCVQRVLVAKPSGDETRYTFFLNSGAWNTKIETFTGTISTGALLQTVEPEYDFTNSCVMPSCFGAAYVRPTRVTTTVPLPNSGSLSSKVEYTYDSKEKGNIIVKKEWNFYSGSPGANPDRKTETTYLTDSNYTSRNIINRPTAIVQKTGGGTTVAEILFEYDNASLTSATGKTSHDDSNYGTGFAYRGNVTKTRRWIASTSYWDVTYTYDMLGNRLTETTPNSSTKTLSYSDSFYRDNGSNPPQSHTPTTATNAYLTQVTLCSGCDTQYFSYYFDTGKKAIDKDTNNASMFYHYDDPLDRRTVVYGRPLSGGSRGW